MKAKGYENAYFGFSDESSEGNWKWVNGTSTSYTNWHSGEPSNQDGIEHYAMFYEKFQDGTWNDADGIIDAGCAYICEWDDPTDKISQEIALQISNCESLQKIWEFRMTLM